MLMRIGFSFRMSKAVAPWTFNATPDQSGVALFFWRMLLQVRPNRQKFFGSFFQKRAFFLN